MFDPRDAPTDVNQCPSRLRGKSYQTSDVGVGGEPASAGTAPGRVRVRSGTGAHRGPARSAGRAGRGSPPLDRDEDLGRAGNAGCDLDRVTAINGLPDWPNVSLVQEPGKSNRGALPSMLSVVRADSLVDLFPKPGRTKCRLRQARSNARGRSALPHARTRSMAFVPFRFCRGASTAAGWVVGTIHAERAGSSLLRPPTLA